MAHQYIHVGHGKHGLKLRSALTKLEDGRKELFEMRDVMVRMRDGDGSDPAHYAEVTARFPFVSDADAKAAYDEIASACFKLETNASVSDVANALEQLFDKMRG